MERPLVRRQKVTTRITIAFNEKTTDWLCQKSDDIGITIQDMVRRVVDDARIAEEQNHRSISDAR